MKHIADCYNKLFKTWKQQQLWESLQETQTELINNAFTDFE